MSAQAPPRARLFVTDLPQQTAKEAMERVIHQYVPHVKFSVKPLIYMLQLNFSSQQDADEVYDKCNYAKIDGITLHIFHEKPTSIKDQGLIIALNGVPATYRDERKIQNLLSKYGNVKDVRINPTNPRIKVYFSSEDEAQRALSQLKDFTLDGQLISAQIFYKKANATTPKLPPIMVAVTTSPADMNEAKMREWFPTAYEIAIFDDHALIVFQTYNQADQAIYDFRHDESVKIIREFPTVETSSTFWNRDVIHFLESRRVTIPFHIVSTDVLKSHMSKAGQIISFEHSSSTPVIHVQYATSEEKDKALALDRTRPGDKAPIRVLPFVHRNIHRSSCNPQFGLLQLNEMPPVWTYDEMLSHFDRSKITTAVISRVTHLTTVGFILFTRYDDAVEATNQIRELLPNVFLHPPYSMQTLQGFSDNDRFPGTCVINYTPGQGPLPTGPNIIYAGSVNMLGKRIVMVTYENADFAVNAYCQFIQEGHTVEYTSVNPYASFMYLMFSSQLAADWNGRFLFVRGGEIGQSNQKFRSKMEMYGDVEAAMVSLDQSGEVGADGIVLFKTVQGAKKLMEVSSFEATLYRPKQGYQQPQQAEPEKLKYLVPQQTNSSLAYIKQFIALNAPKEKQQAMLTATNKMSIAVRMQIVSTFEKLVEWYETALSVA